MATRYQDISYGSFGGGIDQLSPESKIPDDFVELLDNVDPTPNGSLVKRTGTQLFGSVPVRVERIEYIRVGTPGDYSGELCFFLDTSVDVISLRSTPIYVYGRTSEGQAAGDFTSVSSGKYYPKFTTDVRQSVLESNGITEQTTTILLEGNTHDQGPLLAFGLFQSISSTNLGNQVIVPTNVKVDKLSADVTAEVTTGLTSDESTVIFDTFAVAKSRAFDPGTSYVYTASLATAAQFNAYQSWLAAGSPAPEVVPYVTVSIPAGTHNLTSFNILADCYLDNGTEYERIVPDSYVITPAGSVELSFSYYQNFDLVACLYAAPSSQSKLQLVESGEINETIVVDYPDTPFLFYQLFAEQLDGSRVAFYGSANLDTVNAAAASAVLDVRLLPGATSDYRATFYVTNQSGTDLTTLAVWDYGRLVSNKLCVEASDPVIDTFAISIPGSEHKLGEFVATTLLQSTNPTNDNNLLIQYDEVSTAVVDDTVTINLSNNTTSQFTAYAILADRSLASGAYHHPATLVAANIPPSPSTVTTISIPASTHGKGADVNLTLFRVVPGTGTTTSYEELPVTELTIGSTGDITLLVENTGTSEYYVIPVVYAVTNTATSASIASGTTGTLSISSLTNPFAFIHVYQISGTDRIRITPDRVSVNSILGTASIQLTNNTGSALTYKALWDYADYTSEEVVPITSSSGTGYRDNNPQMTIWGLPHRQLYSGATGSTPGYVTHVDVYRAQAEERPVCGLGGNLYNIIDFNEAPASYGMGEYYPNLRARVDTPVVIGPAFINTTDGDTSRTQGVIRFTTAGNNLAAIVRSVYQQGTEAYPDYSSSSTYTTGAIVRFNASYYQALMNVPAGQAPSNTAYWEEVFEGHVTYRLYVPNLSVIGSLSQIFNSSEFLTVSGMGYSINNGEFQVISAALVPSSDYLDVTVYNPELDTADWNEASSDGRAGIFTDRIPLEVTCPFFENDRLLSASWGEEQLLTVTGTSAGNEVRMDGLYENVNIPDGLLLVGSRTSRIIPLRSLNAIPTTQNLVAGDILSFTNLNRELRAKFVNPRPDEVVSISSNLTYTLDDNPPVRVNVADSNLFQVGQRILLLNAGQFTGEQVIRSIISPTQFELETTAYTPALGGCVIFGYNVEVDEDFPWFDSLTSTISFTVTRRWWPIEEPDNDYLQLPPNRYRYFNSAAYDNQPFLRSTMVQDTMYLTNGLDAVQRYDGQNLTRAGLFRWQAGLYLTVDTTTPKITPNPFSTTQIKSVADNYFQVNKYVDKHFAIGETIRYSYVNGSGVTITRSLRIENTWDAANESYIEVNIDGVPLATGTSPSLSKITTYSYYYRLNMIDVNGNVIASAVTGAQDARVDVAAPCSIRHLLLRPPFLDNFDFARIEVQVYRTKGNGSAPYYLISTLQPSWNIGGDAYLEFVDTANDNTLASTNLDAVNAALLGQELGQTWTGPLRSKYLTSNSNSLVLANFRSWPSLSLRPLKLAETLDSVKANYAGRKLLILKDSNDIGLTTDNTNRMQFEFLTTGAHTISLSGAAIDYDTNELTITNASHGLVEGNWIYLFFANNGITSVDPRVGGHYQVTSVVDANSFRIQLSNTLLDSININPLNGQDVNRYVHAVDPRDIPVWIETDLLYGSKAGSIQGTVDPITYVFLRLANAINSAQAACNTQDFVPWMVANAGGEWRDNRIVIETPYVTESRLAAILPSFDNVAIYANELRVNAGSKVLAEVQVFPSRILVSYPNYPEIFDAPLAFLDTDSESAIDINPSDGQEITGVIPFFGESAFGAAQKDSILLVFKTASVYLVNIAAKRAGQPCVQRLDTRGLGCTAPYSIAPTQNGIMFANQSGIYRITTNLQCQYIGRRVERIWKEEVDLNQLDLQLHGHYYPLGHQYKLSVPYREDERDYSQRVLVYNTVREYTADGYRDGSWTSYSNMPAIGWANMLRQPLFATPNGEVFTLRMTGDSTDYRDDGSPIEAVATLRAMDFGSASIRKAVASFNMQFRPEDKDSEVVVEASIDLIDNWETLDQAVVSKQRVVGNINNRATQDLAVIQYMSNKRKGVYYQLRVSNGKLDQGMQLNGASMMVAGIGSEGIIQAKETGTGRG